MKKLLCFALSLMMILSVAVVPTVAETTELDIPEGAVKMSELAKVPVEQITTTLAVHYDKYTDNDKFYIGDANDLRIFSAVSNATDQNGKYDSTARTSFDGKTVYLAADIDMAGVTDFKPISNHADCTTSGRPRFMGSFDGQGHTIKNLKVESSEGNVGLFGFVLTGVRDNIATIQNLVIDPSCSFAYTGNSSDVGVGSLIGGLRIEDYTTQSGFSDLTLTNVGAVIKNVKSYANVTSTQYAGGLIGQISHSEGFFESTVVISDCIYGGTVKGTQGAAGIAFARKVGNFQPMGFDIIGCTVSGNVVSNGDTAGILVQSDNKSSARKTSIKNCVVSGTVEGEVTDAILISPFIGSQYLTVTGCDTSNATVNSVGVAGYDYKAAAKKTITTPITEIATATGVKEFYVSTPSELEFFADYVNRLGSETTLKACLYGYTIYLTANIDMASVNDFQPIGLSDSIYFSGTFDGQGYVIDNLKIKTSADTYVGLFGVVHGAVIKNVVLGQGCSFEYNGTGTAYVGSVVGRTRNIAISNDNATSIGVTNPGILYGKVLNCYSAATVNSTSSAGGIAGIADA
ncbi:MAG: hypothetical protein IKC59_00160, partial [Clostridia bacterium]|nr:hypothetical protein [Clostridia bacterium]